MFGVRPHFSAAAAYAVVAWSFLIDLLGSLVKGLDWLRDSSVFTHLKLAPATNPDWATASVIILLGVAMATHAPAVGNRCPVVIPRMAAASVQSIADPRLTLLCTKLMGLGYHAGKIIEELETSDPNAPLRTWTPTRRSSHDFHFEPVLVGATPFWLAARFSQPGVMRLLAKHGADPLFVHHSDEITGRGFQHHKEATSALMAAAGMGGGSAWVKPARGELEALTLEAVKLAVELGCDVNAVNTDGSVALDGAKALGYESVVQFLIEKGARSNGFRPKASKPVSDI